MQVNLRTKQRIGNINDDDNIMLRVKVLPEVLGQIVGDGIEATMCVSHSAVSHSVSLLESPYDTHTLERLAAGS